VLAMDGSNTKHEVYGKLDVSILAYLKLRLVLQIYLRQQADRKKDQS
jgi:hypothetical protein